MTAREEREKIRRGVKRCSAGTCPSVLSKEYEECEYTMGLYCRQDILMREIGKMMEPGEPEIEGDGRSSWWWVCPDCHGAIDKDDGFCRHCGKELKWK